QSKPYSTDKANTINETSATLAAWVSTGVTDLSSPALVNNHTQFTFQIVGPNNCTYTVEYTADYLTWTLLGNYVLSSGSISVTNNIGSEVNRFYRAKLGTNYLGDEVGFIKKSLPASYSIIASQLDNSDTTIVTVLP